MTIVTAYSVKENTHDAINDIKEQFGEFIPRMVLFFSSSCYDPLLIGAKFQEAFANAETFGCSTSGEIVSGKILKNSVVAMGFSYETIPDMKIHVIENISQGFDMTAAFHDFENHFNTPSFEMDSEKYVGIILIDGLCGLEDQIMDEIGDLTNVLFVGSSAGDDLKFEKTYVFAQGKAYTDTVLLILLKPAMPFGLIKTQSFTEKNKSLVATKVSDSQREVIEFNDKPAAIAYAEALGIEVQDAESNFMSHPLGLMIEGEPYVRSPQRIQGETMSFYSNVLQGMELDILESNNIIEDTRLAIQKKALELGSISAVINFNCILRTLQLEKENQIQAYGNVFKDIPTIGLSTYGEEYIGHINQTATMLVFK